MRKDKTRKLVFTSFLLIVFICVLLLAASIREAIGEQIDNTVEQLNEPVDLNVLSFAALNQFIVSSKPEYCDGMKFVKGTMQIQFNGDSILIGEAVLTYFRLIDESMEGGNIEANECYFDLATNTLLRIEHWEGSGRSFPVNNQEISGSAFTAPLSEYLIQAPNLMEGKIEKPFLLNAYCDGNWVDVALLSKQSEEQLYAEHLTSWPTNNTFNSREFVLIPNESY